MDPTPDAVVDFWFGAEGSPERGRAREAWFRKDPAFDASIRVRFGAAVEQALAGGFEAWDATPAGALARIVLLDQFTRNVFRDTPRAFAGDARALAAAESAVARGFDRALDPVQRGFVYLPFEHAEDAAMQHRSLALFGALARETGDDTLLVWARKHADVIFRFGRYPHRNAILGRASTPEEVAFLAEPGSRF
ncbi:MAG: DUF924 domain-containing protein [Betaproteobacteria bacterium]|jgi:uncharacterized protein (DUF924 family)|nr:DUF924 domain-containing protein [Betaproteobacteria bacterium]MCC7218793.1 DUF924 domain-containing protein [Burkholderiales bacterium]